MGKKNKCISTLRGKKSKDQGGKEIKGRATIYTPEKMSLDSSGRRQNNI